MRLKIIACKTLTRELGYLSSCCPNETELIWLNQSLCEDPDQMRNVLQAYVDELEDHEANSCDAIILATGLCGDAVWGVRSRRIPLVLPRAHDSISLLLGSSERYRDIFEEHNGELLWLSPGILEHRSPCRTSGGWAEEEGLCAEDLARSRYQMPDCASRQRTASAIRYGIPDCASRQHATSTIRYSLAAYVQLPNVSYPNFRGEARAAAASRGLELTEYGGNDGWLRDMLAAHWDENRFLVVPPTRTCEPSYDHRILKLED